MTKASMSLAELAEKGPDADLLREMIQFVARWLMDLDVETLCGATPVVGHLEQGGLATGDLQDAVRLAGAIEDAFARRDFASLGLAAGYP